MTIFFLFIAALSIVTVFCQEPIVIQEDDLKRTEEDSPNRHDEKDMRYKNAQNDAKSAIFGIEFANI